MMPLGRVITPFLRLVLGDEVGRLRLVVVQRLAELRFHLLLHALLEAGISRAQLLLGVGRLLLAVRILHAADHVAMSIGSPEFCSSWPSDQPKA
jgi:hypothetical protein